MLAAIANVPTTEQTNCCIAYVHGEFILLMFVYEMMQLFDSIKKYWSCSRKERNRKMHAYSGNPVSENEAVQLGSELFDVPSPEKIRKLEELKEKLSPAAKKLRFEEMEEDETTPSTKSAETTMTTIQQSAGSSAGIENPLLEQISVLLDRKLAPLNSNMKALETQVQKQQQSMNKEINGLKTSVAKDIKNIHQRLDDLEKWKATATNQNDGDTTMGIQVDPGLAAQMQALQVQVQQLKISRKQTKDSIDDTRLLTTVVGGLKSFNTADEANTWVRNFLWSKWAPMPCDYFIKGEFNGILFMKFSTPEDRNTILKIVKDENIKCNGNKVWFKPDLPLPVRVNQSFLFRIKHFMVNWGYDRKAL